MRGRHNVGTGGNVSVCVSGGAAGVPAVLHVLPFSRRDVHVALSAQVIASWTVQGGSCLAH